MVFTFVPAATRANYGTFEPHKKLLDSESWFPPVKTYAELPHWWHDFISTMDPMLLGAGTSIDALITWYAGNADNYLLTQLEDMMLASVLRRSAKGIPQLEVVFNNATRAARGTKQSSAAYILSGIRTEVTAATTVAVGVARQKVRQALDVPQPLGMAEITAYCTTAQSALSAASSLLSTAEYAGVSHDASYRISHVFANTTFDAQWLRTSLDATGAPLQLHDRLAEIVRAFSLLQTFAPSTQTAPAGAAGAFSAAAKDTPKDKTVRRCNACNAVDHIAWKCPKAKICSICNGKHNMSACNADRQSLTCSKCGRTGHVDDACRSTRKKKEVAQTYSKRDPARATPVRSLLDSGSRDVVTPTSDLLANQGPPSVTLTGIAGPVRPTSSGVLSATVKGIRAGRQVSHPLPPVPAHVLPEAPTNLLGLGRLVLDHEYHFRWDSQGAALYSPDGTTIPLSVSSSDYTISLALTPMADESARRPVRPDGGRGGAAQRVAMRERGRRAERRWRERGVLDVPR